MAAQLECYGNLLTGLDTVVSHLPSTRGRPSLLKWLPSQFLAQPMTVADSPNPHSSSHSAYFLSRAWPGLSHYKTRLSDPGV